MPHVINYLYRLYCKNCKDFTLHERVFDDENSHPKYSICNFPEDKIYVSVCECNTQYTPMLISEIEESKVQEQRKRFKLQRLQEFEQMLTSLLPSKLIKSNILDDLYNDNMFSGIKGAKTEIIESNAGLKKEEEIQKEQQNKLKQAIRQELLRFKHVGRNDKCLCDSGKKYKQCCLITHKEISL